MDERGKKGRHSGLHLRMAFGKRKACAPREGHNVFGFPVRAATAVRPYAELINETKVKSPSQSSTRCVVGCLARAPGDESVSQRHQWCQCVPATSARARGTHHASALNPYPFRQFITAGGHGGPPQRRALVNNAHSAVVQYSQTSPSHVPRWPETCKHRQY